MARQRAFSGLGWSVRFCPLQLAPVTSSPLVQLDLGSSVDVCDSTSGSFPTRPQISLVHLTSRSRDMTALLSPPRSPCPASTARSPPLSPAMASLARFLPSAGTEGHSHGLGGHSRPASPCPTDSAPPSPRAQRFVRGVQQHTADCWARMTRQRSSHACFLSFPHPAICADAADSGSMSKGKRTRS